MTNPSFIEVKSSNLAAVAHMHGDLYVKFHDGAVYKHKDVPDDLFAAIQASDSPGKFYHGRIKGKFVSEKVTMEEPKAIVDDNGNGHPANSEEENTLVEAIKSAVDGLDHGNDDHWNDAGEPNLNYLSDLLDTRVSREQVDAATKNVRRHIGQPDAANSQQNA